MAWQRGEVVLVSYPYTDLSTTKARPAVVLSGDLYHCQEPDVVLGAFTSNTAAAVGPLDYILTDWEAAGLRFPTAFKPVVATLEPGLIVHRIGALSPQDLHEVIERVKLVFEVAETASSHPHLPEEPEPICTPAEPMASSPVDAEAAERDT